jgi:hypothetical protein
LSCITASSLQLHADLRQEEREEEVAKKRNIKEIEIRGEIRSRESLLYAT